MANPLGIDDTRCGDCDEQITRNTPSMQDARFRNVHQDCDQAKQVLYGRLPPQPKQGRTNERRQPEGTRAGPVTVTGPNGHFRLHSPYDPAETTRIIEKGQRKPRTWDELASDGGGGHDRRSAR
jgi:hypothetical protein